jgi:5-methyltetrahydrofolate--homocysteine methyltransferase
MTAGNLLFEGGITVGKQETLNTLKQNVISGKAKDVEATCKQAIAEKIPAPEILNNGLLAGMTIVGDKFSKGEFFIPEMLVAARAMKAGMALLKPELAKTPAKSMGKVVLGTVSGDLHDIGKNLACIMMGSAGFEVVDLGIDVSAKQFVEEVKKSGAVAVGLSALLTTTMVNMEPIIKDLRASGFKGKVVIGGAPVTQEFATKIGADVYAADAAEGARKLKEIIARN